PPYPVATPLRATLELQHLRTRKPIAVSGLSNNGRWWSTSAVKGVDGNVQVETPPVAAAKVLKMCCRCRYGTCMWLLVCLKVMELQGC
ncbi:hypothetical protein M8C21_031291, partial [Ambrosia artemisiifolia]